MKDSMIANNNRPPAGTGTANRRRGVLVALTVAVVWAVGLLVGGCTSDPASLVGARLIDNQIDSTLLSIDIVATDAFSGIRVDDGETKLPEQQTLYMGGETNTKTSFLANFDFAGIDSDVYPDSIFTVDNIKTVKLNLTKLLPYGSTRDSTYTYEDPANPDSLITITVKVPTGQPLELYYHVFELEGPFDPLAYENYPASVPPRFPPHINVDFFEPNIGTEVSLKLYAHDLLRWKQTGGEMGLMLRLGDLSDPGLVGFASRELTVTSEVPSVEAKTIVGPEIIVEFQIAPELFLSMLATDDVTVFEEVAPAAQTKPEAATGFILRTGLRSYPAFRFDLSRLPPNALINKAVLSVTNDNSTSYGPEFSVQVSEITAEVMDDPAYLLDVSTLRDSTRIYPLDFRSNLRPNIDKVIEFDITTGIRRAVNLVNEEPRGFLLSGVEDRYIFPFTRRPPDLTKPDFYYRQMNFLGFEDPDPAHRPFLRVWYSVVDELSGGGQ